jgi:hypothetical protein
LIVFQKLDKSIDKNWIIFKKKKVFQGSMKDLRGEEGLGGFGLVLINLFSYSIMHFTCLNIISSLNIIFFNFIIESP